MLALVVIFLNFYLRVCFRFLAAMRLRLIACAHPVFLSPPLLFIFFYGICHFVPICQINILLKQLGMNLYCVKGKMLYIFNLINIKINLRNSPKWHFHGLPHFLDLVYVISDLELKIHKWTKLRPN